MAILIDTNVIVDVLTDDPEWADWSEGVLSDHAGSDPAINPVIFAELSFGCESVAEVERIVREFGFRYLETPRDGLFRAARAFGSYKKAGGTKDFVLPDFFIGGHAEASGMALVTRDVGRYRTYFPGVELICP